MGDALERRTLLMTTQVGPDDDLENAEAEPVLVERGDEEVRFILDDGRSITFDAGELIAELEE